MGADEEYLRYKNNLMMLRFLFILSILLVPGLSGLSQQKNIIFIIADDHRYDAMGFMKKIPWLETPGLDRLAAEGIHIRNAYVSTALCSPSRASVLTGDVCAQSYRCRQHRSGA